MKLFGGEIETPSSPIFEYLTDSGRSSLRLILSELKTKKFLLPNYLCKVIIDLFLEYDISFSFYNVNNNLSVDPSSINTKNYDVFYLINYFGQNNHHFNGIIDEEKILIEDSVFLPIFTKPDLVKHWIGFNSYRKILPIADGSLLKSTINLPKELINNTEPEFVYIKDSAKIKKFEYLNYNRHSQEEYIRLFKLAENSLNNQKTAHKISTKSLIWLINSIDNFEKEYSTRNENFITLDDSLRVISNIRKPKHPSFYVINVDKRDALRKHLASENIYLPVHWPKPNMVDHPLYNRLISIPVDSRYNLNDMNKVADNIKRFYNI